MRPERPGQCRLGSPCPQGAEPEEVQRAVGTPRPRLSHHSGVREHSFLLPRQQRGGPSWESFILSDHALISGLGVSATTGGRVAHGTASYSHAAWRTRLAAGPLTTAGGNTRRRYLTTQLIPTALWEALSPEWGQFLL